MRTVDAVYWAKTASDGYGEATYAAPVELKVRWVDKQEEFIDDDAEKQLSRAKVFAGQDVNLYSYFFRGTLDDLPSDATDPEDLKDSYDLHQVRQNMEEDNIRATNRVYMAWLV